MRAISLATFFGILFSPMLPIQNAVVAKDIQLDRTSRVSLVLVSITNAGNALSSLPIGDFDNMAKCKEAASGAERAREIGGEINLHYELYCVPNGK